MPAAVNPRRHGDLRPLPAEILGQSRATSTTRRRPRQRTAVLPAQPVTATKSYRIDDLVLRRLVKPKIQCTSRYINAAYTMTTTAVPPKLTLWYMFTNTSAARDVYATLPVSPGRTPPRLMAPRCVRLATPAIRPLDKGMSSPGHNQCRLSKDVCRVPGSHTVMLAPGACPMTLRQMTLRQH